MCGPPLTAAQTEAGPWGTSRLSRVGCHALRSASCVPALRTVLAKECADLFYETPELGLVTCDPGRFVAIGLDLEVRDQFAKRFRARHGMTQALVKRLPDRVESGQFEREAKNRL